MSSVGLEGHVMNVQRSESSSRVSPPLSMSGISAGDQQTPAQLRSAPPPVSLFHSSINQQSKLHSSALFLSDDVSEPAGSLLSLKQIELLTSNRKWNEMTVSTGKESYHIGFTEPETLEKELLFPQRFW